MSHHREEPTARRILLVEDHSSWRHIVSGALTAAGYVVREAATGVQALAAIEEWCPDILLSDLVLPGVNGQELANRCRRRCPDTAIVFMSGYSEEELHRLDIKQVVFLAKPISTDELVRTLNRVAGDGA